MKLLIFDTETTGLPINKNIPAEHKSDNWPHIVSIAWIVLDVDTNKVIKKKKYVIKPINWIIPKESTAIHRITHENALTNGFQLHDVLLEFITENYDMLVAHNLKFDYNVLRNAMIWDLKWLFNPLKKPKCCTMETSLEICMLPGRDGQLKYPRLSELYYHTFKQNPSFETLHDAMVDTILLTEIIKECDELRTKLGLPIKPNYNK